MDSLLSNAALATVLAAVVLLVTRFWRRPPVVYWLWLLVLSKLVTPAVLPLPILVSAESKPTQQAVAPLTLAEAEALLATLEDGANVERRGPAEPLELAAPAELPNFETGAPFAMSVVEPPAVVEPVPGPVAISLDWRAIVASVWIAGSVLWILVVIVRVVRFDRLAAQALPAPEWIDREARQIAERFGLRRCPPIRVVAARIPPLVWAIHARPIVLLPSPLLTELNDEQMSALLAHELAHVRRGDHWVRRLELLVLSIYWWHPVAWLARRRLEEAEEQCCDAWVTWCQPVAARGYADALVRTVEFLSGPPCPAPIGASGIGPVRSLERRIQMILNERTPRRLSWKSALFVLAVSMLVLPWSAWAQDEPGRESPEARQERERDEAVGTDRDTGPREAAGRMENADDRRDPERDGLASKLPATLAGIGASLRNDGDYTVVQSIIPGGAADRGGSLKPNDRIVGVGEGVSGAIEDIVDMRLNDVVRKLRGERGTVVTLVVIPAGESERKLITITRDVVALEDIEARDDQPQEREGGRNERRRDRYMGRLVPADRDAQRQFKIYQLEEADASIMQTLIQTLFEGSSMRVVSDARTNSVIVFASPPDIATIEALLLVLDAKVERPARPATPAPPVLFPSDPGPIERPPTREGNNNARGRSGEVRSEPRQVQMLADPDNALLQIRGAEEDVNDVVSMLQRELGRPEPPAATIRRLQEEIKQLKAQIDRMTKEAKATEGTSVFPQAPFGPEGTHASEVVPAGPPEPTLNDLFGRD